MFLFLFSISVLFHFVSGNSSLGRTCYSYWFNNILTVTIFLSILFSFYLMPVTVYGFVFFDYVYIFSLDFMSISLSFYCSTYYLLLIFFIDLVFCYVYYYSFYYMFYDITLTRFLTIFWCFILCMNFFVLSHDIITAYCGWEFLGLFSFLLISYFWYRFFALKFGFKSFLISKFGDIFLILAAVILINTQGFTFLTFYFISFFCFDLFFIVLVIALLLICSFTKSTQFGLHIWLPDAMEGPIPVSALIHAATLVVCGIILLTFIFLCLDFWLNCFYWFFCWCSAILLTISISIFYNFDVKRFVAFSTICQISFAMFCTVCLDLYVGTLFFCYHMFYKSTLFIVLGIWIHLFYGLQDIRCFFLSYFFSCILTRLILIFAIFNSCSLWFLCGFYCKDQLLAVLVALNYNYVLEIGLLSIIFIFLTVLYNYYLLFYLCFVLKCFSFNDVAFIFFDFESSLVYCSFSIYLCIILLALIIDLINSFLYSSNALFWLYANNFFFYFDVALFIVVVILILSFFNYGSSMVMLFCTDCINLFWRMFIIIIYICFISLFNCWYFCCFIIYVLAFSWNFVVHFRYNLKYFLFFCFLMLFMF